MDTVRHILFYVPTHPGNLMLAELGDRTLCVLRNDQPLQEYRWPHEQMTEAVKAFEKFKATVQSQH